MNDAEDSVVLKDMFVRVMRNWLFLVACGVAGALFGILFGRIFPPIYEAEAILGVSIQYAIAEPRELVLEDRILHRVAQVVMSDETFDGVLERISPEMRAQNEWVEAEDIRQVVHLERRLTDWKLVASHPMPEVAQQVASIWMDVAFEALMEAQDHAWQAVALMGGQSFELMCVRTQMAPDSGLLTGWDCTVEPINLNPQALAGLVRTELELSRGILPAIVIQKAREPDIPEEPVLRSRNLLILGGAVIGLVFGFWIVGVLGVRFPRFGRRMEQASG